MKTTDTLDSALSEHYGAVVIRRSLPRDPPQAIRVLFRDGVAELVAVEGGFGGLREGETEHRYVLAEPAPVLKPEEEFFTADERAVMLGKMAEASALFYGLAVQARCHSFIEFTGFMNEFIELCHEAQRQGIDWTQSTAHHPAASLPMQPWHAQYLGEKFGCIFAGTFARKPELLAIFLAALKEG